MKIYLVRHGESVTAGSDNTRALSKKGKEDIKALAKFILRDKIEITNLYHSGKMRALQTAELLLPSIKLENPMQERAELDPIASVDPILEEIYAWDKDVMLVGHMPFMGRLVGKLVTGNENRNIIEFKTGTMVCLEQVEREHWLICWMLTPSLLGN